MLRTPLHESQRQLGATFAPYGDWELPASFGSEEDEYRAVSNATGLLDRSARARLVVAGGDRYTWLQGMVSNDVRRLEKGEQSIQACLLNATGHMLANLTIVNREDSLLLDLDWAVRQRTFDLLAQYIITEDVEIVDQSEFLACISIQGPSAAHMKDEGLETYAKSAYSSDHTREGGYDFYVHAADAVELYQDLIDRGAKPVGENVSEILRVEAGIARYGVDMDETTIPLEAGLEATHISYEKGCYMGQEIIARIQSRGHTNRVLTRFYVVGDGLPGSGARILAYLDGETRDVGWITSVAQSPSAGPIALGYLRHEVRGSDARLTTENGCLLMVTELPFV